MTENTALEQGAENVDSPPAEEHQFTAEEQSLLDSQAADEEAAIEAQAQADAEEEKSVADKPWFQKRMDKLAKQKGEETRRADRLEKIIENMSTQQPAQPVERPVEQPFVFNVPKPTLESCDFDTEVYSDKLTDWKLDARDAERTAAQVKHERETSQITAQQTFTESVEAANRKGNAKYSDYQEKLDALPGDVMHVGLASAILETAEPSDVAYYLAQNPDEAARIARLPQAKMFAEVVRLEAKAIVPVPTKKKTEAPQPVVPIVSGTESAGAEPDAKKDPDAWIIWERNRCAKLGKRY